MRSTNAVLLVRPSLTRIGNTAMRAGRVNTENKNAAPTPMAVMLPRSWNGGASLKFMLRNPTAVVTLVRNTGCMFTRRLSTSASCFSVPRRIEPSIVMRM